MGVCESLAWVGLGVSGIGLMSRCGLGGSAGLGRLINF